MKTITVKKAARLTGTIEVPADKSISHRAVMLGSIAKGITRVNNFLMGDDCKLTIKAFKKMGVKIKVKGDKVTITGNGLCGLRMPAGELYLGNSGTTMRIIMGILAGQGFDSTLRGDASLSKRPMKRVAEPLRKMGADIEGRRTTDEGRGTKDDVYPPIKIQGRYPLKAIKYALPVASAQVKSAILLAGLYADGITTVKEAVKSRDHTERMMKEFGCHIKINGLNVSISSSGLRPRGVINIPGDISSAAFFIVAALVIGSSKIRIRNVGLNPTRTGIIDILKKMGAKINISNIKKNHFEPTGDITVTHSELKAVKIPPGILPRLIDELPAVMVAAVFAKGQTVISQASELRVKETDRIYSMVTNLRKMGAHIRSEGDSVIINGVESLRGATVDSYGDHRTAMSMIIAGLAAQGSTRVLDTECISKSFPGFHRLLSKLI